MLAALTLRRYCRVYMNSPCNFLFLTAFVFIFSGHSSFVIVSLLLMHNFLVDILDNCVLFAVRRNDTYTTTLFYFTNLLHHLPLAARASWDFSDATYKTSVLAFRIIDAKFVDVNF